MDPIPAQYLLRCDDLCPTIASEPWQRIQNLIQESGIRPILAVVPANQDKMLEASPPDSAFWKQMRALQASGATIGLHGYQHLCNSRGTSLVPLHRTTEFAGVPEEMQRKWIRTGIGILRSHGLYPHIWVAPRHGFDCGTLNALCSEGIGLVSDGLGRIPFTQGGVTWIPQQLWQPVEKPKGLWTICIHPNTVTEPELLQLIGFVRKHGRQFTSVDRVLAELHPVELSGVDRISNGWAHGRVQISRIRKALVRRPFNESGTRIPTVGRLSPP